MKDIYKTLMVANIPTIILLGITGYMIYADKDNWGWVLLAAMLFAYGPKTKDDDSD